MKSTNKVSIFVLMIVCLLSTGQVSAAGVGNNIAVRLVGTGQAYGGDELFNEFGLTPLDAVCFDLDLVDAKTGNTIGVAIECLSC